MRIPRARMYSGYRLPALSFAYQTITVFGWASHPIQLDAAVRYPVRNPENIAALGLASSAFARRY